MLLVLGGTASALAQSGGGAGFGIHWVDVPAEYADDPRSSTYLLDHVPPGSSFARRLGIVNYGPDAIEARVYPATAEAVDGQFVIRDDVRTEVLDWIRSDTATVQVPPRSEEFVTIRFDLPADAPEGEHLAAVMTEVTTASGTVDVVSRLGARVYLSVGEGGSPPANFSIVKVTPSRTPDGTAHVSVEAENTGGRTLDLVGELELSDGPGGLRAGPFEHSAGTTLAPGQRGTVEFLLNADLPAGPWTARVILRSGLLERAAEATIAFPEVAGESAEAVEATEVPLHRDRGFLAPLALGLLLLALLLVFLAWYLRRRREDSDQPAAESTPVVEAAP